MNASDVTFDETTHTYWYGMERLPSVSELMRPITSAYLTNIPEHILEWKRDLGTAVHRACELWDAGVQQSVTGGLTAMPNTVHEIEAPGGTFSAALFPRGARIQFDDLPVSARSDVVAQLLDTACRWQSFVTMGLKMDDPAVRKLLDQQETLRLYIVGAADLRLAYDWEQVDRVGLRGEWHGEPNGRDDARCIECDAAYDGAGLYCPPCMQEALVTARACVAAEAAEAVATGRRQPEVPISW